MKQKASMRYGPHLCQSLRWQPSAENLHKIDMLMMQIFS